MADETLISWADMTFNPWVGCTRISPACDGCYAAHLMETRMGRAKWGGPGIGAGTRDRTSEANWRKPLAWDKKAKAEGKSPFVFCSSLADVFDNEVPVEWRKDLFELILKTPNLVWLLLTKRPQNIVKMFDRISHVREEWPRNAAIGTTVEDQTRADINLPALKVAKVELNPLFTFGSFEPLLGPITIPPAFMPDWVITGGETDQGGHKARITELSWTRSLRDQAAVAGVPYHHKQNGEWLAWDQMLADGNLNFLSLGKAPERYQHVNGMIYSRVGKKLSGRTIDGITHDDFPEVRQ
jgi:protein gp37